MMEAQNTLIASLLHVVFDVWVSYTRPLMNTTELTYQYHKEPGTRINGKEKLASFQ